MLIAWLSKVIRSYEYYQETLFLATNIIDRFLLLTPIALECFQLLGISSLFIAAKQVLWHSYCLYIILQYYSLKRQEQLS